MIKAKRIIWGLALALSATLLSSCKKDGADIPDRPKSLVGTTWIMPLSQDRGYYVYKFSSGSRYQKELLDKNAIRLKIEEVGRYSIETENSLWEVVFYSEDGFINDGLYINYSEGYMWRESQRYQRQ